MHLYYTQLEKTFTFKNFFHTKHISGFMFFLTLKSISLNYLSGDRKRYNPLYQIIFHLTGLIK